MPETTQPAKRLSLSQIVELLLTRSTPERSAVTLTRNASGETQIEVTVRTGDEGEAVTVADAEERAREVYDRLRESYPSVNGHDAAEVGLTRNARGETQIAVTVKSATGSAVTTLGDARDAASEAFSTLRARFPLATGPDAGMVTKAGKEGDE